jgi:hypothetical protein
MITEEFVLPSNWASYFVNADTSGYSDEELDEIQSFEDSIVARYNQCICVDVSENTNITAMHDAQEILGDQVCEVATFTFDVSEE